MASSFGIEKGYELNYTSRVGNRGNLLLDGRMIYQRNLGKIVAESSSVRTIDRYVS